MCTFQKDHAGQQGDPQTITEVFQERDGGGLRRACWRRWRDRGKGEAQDASRTNRSALGMEEMMEVRTRRR